MSSSKVYAYLGADPVPGDCERVSSLAEQLTGAATSLGNVLTLLKASAEGEWRGETATEFRAMLRDDFTPKVEAAEGSFAGAGAALASWADSLNVFRARADELDRRLMLAQNRLEERESALTRLNYVSEPAANHDWQVSQAERRAADARLAVEAIWSEVQALTAEYRSAAADVAGQLNTSTAYAPNEPGWFESVIDWVADTGEALGHWAQGRAEWLLQWAAENAEFLEALGDVLSVAVGILGLLSFIPGAQVLGLAAVGLSLLAAGAQYLAATGRAGSFSEGLKSRDMWFSLAGAALGGGAILATAKAAPAVGSVTPGIFSLMKPSNVGYSMETAELGWRLVDVTLDQGGLALNARTFFGSESSVPGTEEAIGRGFRYAPNPGALLRLQYGSAT